MQIAIYRRASMPGRASVAVHMETEAERETVTRHFPAAFEYEPLTNLIIMRQDNEKGFDYKLQPNKRRKGGWHFQAVIPAPDSLPTMAQAAPESVNVTDTCVTLALPSDSKPPVHRSPPIRPDVPRPPTVEEARDAASTINRFLTVRPDVKAKLDDLGFLRLVRLIERELT